MIIYNYNDKGVFIGQSVADKDPLGDGYLIPRGATTIEPPTPTDNKIPVFINGEWGLQDDFRGTVYYDSEGSEHKIEKVGEKVPENTSLEPRPDSTYKLEKGVWVLDADKVFEKELQEWKYNRQALVENIEVTYNDVIYQGDEKSQDRMSRSINALPDDVATVPWVAKDNSIQHLNKVDLKAILLDAGQQQSVIWNDGRPVKDG